MYAKAHPPGPIKTRNRLLHGITAEGRLVNVTPWEIGMSKPAFRNRYVNAIHRGIFRGPRPHDALNSERKDPIVELRTVGTLYTLADTGVLTEKLPVILPGRRARSEMSRMAWSDGSIAGTATGFRPPPPSISPARGSSRSPPSCTGSSLLSDSHQSGIQELRIHRPAADHPRGRRHGCHANRFYRRRLHRHPLGDDRRGFAALVGFFTRPSLARSRWESGLHQPPVLVRRRPPSGRPCSPSS